MSSAPSTPSASPGAAKPSEGNVFVLTATGGREERKAADIRSHDFRQSGFLAPSELRRIRLRHEQFVRSLASRLTMFLRLEFELQLEKLQIVGYQKFAEGLSNPTHITLFKADPLRGVGLLVIPPRMGLTFVDRLLGGPGQMPDAERDLTEIEVALVDQITTIVLNEWSTHWPEMKELRPALLGHENNSKYLQTATPDTAMLLVTMRAAIGQNSEAIQFVFPYATVEPLMKLLSPALPVADSKPTGPVKPKWNVEFNDVKVPIVAEWHGLRMSAGEITRLQAGDVVLLDPNCAAQVQLRFNQIPKFVGRPGTSGNKWAVQLTRPVNK
jgi:flagellar motor switch protein FliM